MIKPLIMFDVYGKPAIQKIAGKTQNIAATVSKNMKPQAQDTVATVSKNMKPPILLDSYGKPDIQRSISEAKILAEANPHQLEKTATPHRGKGPLELRLWQP